MSSRTRVQQTSLRRTYQNPILPGFHPDPSCCRVQGRYYLVTSSFEYFPGIPWFESTDLVHFEPKGHVLTRKSQLDLTSTASSRGIFAPTLRHHRGRFYLVTTDVDGRGNILVSAPRMEGPWSEPVIVDQEGCDPSLFFDDDGRAYYTRNGPGTDFDHPYIYQARIDVSTGRLQEKPRIIFKGTGGIWPEAPHLFKRDGLYTLIIAEGGTFVGHSVVVARSRSPFGPFRPCPHNPVLTHRGRRHPIQALGHADLVELENGETWAVLLGNRPQRGHHHLGRETFLVPVDFDEKRWPRFGVKGCVELEMAAPKLARPSRSSPRFYDSFDTTRLSPRYQFLRNPPRGSYSLRQRPGFFRFWGLPSTLNDVAPVGFLGHRQPGMKAAFRTRLEFEPQGEEVAGLAVRASEAFHYDLLVRRSDGGREVVLLARRGKQPREMGCLEVGRGPIELGIHATPSSYEFSVTTKRSRAIIGNLPPRGLSAETIAATGTFHFTGAMIGLYATGNGKRAKVPADFDFFEVVTL